MKALLVIALLAVAIGATAALMSGTSLLDFELPGGLPAGNAVSALGLISLASVPVLLSSRGTTLRAVSLATLIGAVAWLPISIAFAGNLELNFSGWRGTAWLGLTLMTHVAALATLAWAAISYVLTRRARAGGTS